MRGTRRFLAVVATVLFGVLVASPAWAADFTVTNGDDSGTGSLRRAVSDANASAGADTITFADGVSAVDLTSGELVVSSDITIQGPGADEIVVRRSSDPGTISFRLFRVDGSGARLALSGLTLANGEVAGTTPAQGGAIHNAGGVLDITDSVITGNTASASGASSNVVEGGAIYSTGTLDIRDSTLSENTATVPTGQAGGGGGAIHNTGRATISGSTLFGNTTTSPDSPSFKQIFGGAIYNDAFLSRGPGEMEISGSTFSENTVSAATSNSSSNTQGGAAYNGGGTLTISGSTFNDNSSRVLSESSNTSRAAQALGGALAGFGVTEATNSTLSGNSAVGTATNGARGEGYGGAISTSISSVLDLTSVTITGNVASGVSTGSGTTSAFGGGIYNQYSGQDLPGSITPQPKNVRNSLIANNSVEGTTTEGPDVRGVFVSGGYNLIGDGSNSTGFTQGTDQVGTAGNPIDPHLAPLADNGGPTRTHALLPESPAIDQGSSFGLTSDQRGEGRPSNATSIPNASGGDASDVGAFELQADKIFVKAPSRSSVDEGGTLAFTGADGISVSYPNAGDADVKVTLAATGATLTLGETTGLTFTEGDGSGDGRMVFTGKLSDVNAALASLNLSPAPGADAASLEITAEAGLLNDDATVAVTVNNLAPTANGDSYETTQDRALRVPAPGVLGNDTDPGDDPLRAEVVSGPSNGEVFVNPDGAFSYFPEAGFTGTDSFTYAATDGRASSAPATVEISVKQATNPDTTPPRVVFTSPRGSRVAPSAVVKVGFSEAMDRSTLTSDTIKVFRVVNGERKPVATTPRYPASSVVTLDPVRDLAPGARYTVVVTTAVSDEAGNRLTERKVWGFRVKPRR